MAVALSMTDTPHTIARCVYNQAEVGAESWLSVFNTSTAGTLLQEVADAPVLVLSVDGQMLKRIRDLAVSAGPAAKAIGPQLAFLDQVKRLGLVATVAPLGSGQSMLPLPDAMFLFETSDPQGAKQGLEDIVSGLLASNPNLPRSPWTEKDAGGGQKI